MTSNVNASIKCSVTNCAYHAQTKDYCTKDEIKVGCCGTNVPTACGSTECVSFKMSANPGYNG